MRAQSLVVLAASLAQRPEYAGHAWVFGQYLLGLRRLGYDVLFLDELPPGTCTDAAGQPAPLSRSRNLRFFLDVMRRFGAANSFSLTYDAGQEVVGLAREDVLRRLRHASAFFNVMGFVTDPAILAAAPLKVFLDIDPGFGQMWKSLGLADIFTGHDRFVTVGANVGRPACEVPTCGLDWVTTPPPVVLERWPAAPVDDWRGGAFTSVASWRGPFGPVEYNGRTYGLRAHEFRKFFDMPRRTGLPFEVALDIHAADAKDIVALDEHGWRRTDPRAAAGDLDAYRRYIAASRAEFMVAKNMYVQTRGGWFSDRSACYLASGRPVVAQDTGLAGNYPLGDGLLTFSTPEEAADAAREVAGNYDHHCRAARDVAGDCFDSDKVLRRLLASLGVD